MLQMGSHVKQPQGRDDNALVFALSCRWIDEKDLHGITPSGKMML